MSGDAPDAPDTSPAPERATRAASDQDENLQQFALALITSRRHISPKRLGEPGPTPAQLEAMFRAAAAAPDHGELVPWRFVIVPREKRPLLAEVFADALLDRDAQATADQVAAARAKAYRAPLLMLALARLGPADPDIAAAERLVSLGAAIQNLLLAAHAAGFGTGLTSGQALKSPRLRELFGLGTGEEPVCFVNVGTATKGKPPRLRPDPKDFVREL